MQLYVKSVLGSTPSVMIYCCCLGMLMIPGKKIYYAMSYRHLGFFILYYDLMACSAKYLAVFPLVTCCFGTLHLVLDDTGLNIPHKDSHVTKAYQIFVCYAAETGKCVEEDKLIHKYCKHSLIIIAQGICTEM